MKISYTITPFHKSELHAIDQIRDSFLTTLIPPALTRQLAWQSKIDRTYSMLTAQDKKIRKTRLDQIFRETTPKKTLPDIEKLAFNYKIAQDYIEENWTINSEHVTEIDVKRLQQALTAQPQKTRNVKAVLEFIQSTPEHPVTQAALAYEMILPLFENKTFAIHIATLTAYIFIYKGGYDIRRQLNLEEYFGQDMQAHIQAAEKAYENGNLSPFLDQFINGVRTQAETVVKNYMEKGAQDTAPRAFFKLNDRQKHIITLLEEPGARLSNKNVQKYYDISQVTASRDLSKLVHLGLIRPHGKGRSVYYTISNS